MRSMPTRHVLYSIRRSRRLHMPVLPSRQLWDGPWRRERSRCMRVVSPRHIRPAAERDRAGRLHLLRCRPLCRWVGNAGVHCLPGGQVSQRHERDICGGLHSLPSWALPGRHRGQLLRSLPTGEMGGKGGRYKHHGVRGLPCGALRRSGSDLAGRPVRAVSKRDIQLPRGTANGGPVHALRPRYPRRGVGAQRVRPLHCVWPWLVFDWGLGYLQLLSSGYVPPGSGDHQRGIVRGLPRGHIQSRPWGGLLRRLPNVSGRQVRKCVRLHVQRVLLLLSPRHVLDCGRSELGGDLRGLPAGDVQCRDGCELLRCVYRVPGGKVWRRTGRKHGGGRVPGLPRGPVRRPAWGGVR